MLHDTEVTIAKIQPEDLPHVVRLWDLSFAPPYDIHSALDYAEKQLSLLLGASHNGKIVAVAGLIDFDMNLADTWIRCGGIAAVATHPSYRRQGLTRKLLHACLAHLYESRVPIAALWPFAYGFYEHFGWSASDLQYRVDINIAGLPNVGNARGYEEIPAENVSALFELHERWCRFWNLSLRRGDKRWSRMLSKPGASWLLFKHPEGYMIIDLKEAQGETLVVREWCYLTDRAFYDGLSLIAQMDSQFNRARWIGAEIDILLKLGIPHPLPTIEVLPGMMTRVVHPQAFEEVVSQKLTGIRLIDPLGISDTDGHGEEIGPGQIVQVVTGFSHFPHSHALRHLHKITGMNKAFSVEKF